MSKRTERVSMEIQRVLSDVLIRGLPDPRVTPISITSVVCSPDLRHAKVHFVPMGGLGNVETILAGLEEIGGCIIREVAKKIKMKTAPQMIYPDEHSLENVDFIDQLDNMTFVDAESERTLTTRL